MHNKELSDSEKQERNLDKSKTYVLKFLFNGSQNKAADPAPFKLANLDTLAKKAIGRPFVIPKWGDQKHVRSHKDTVEDQLEVQAKYSIGEIVDYTKSDTGNYYGIIEVWPEFTGVIKSNLIPDFTSPTVYVNKKDASGQITDAEFLNIQAVPVPGYQPHYAGVNGVCDGQKDSCMRELRTLAAASKLSFIRNDKSQFSNMLSRIKGAMSMEQPASGTGDQDVTKALKGLQTMVQGNTETLEMIGGKLKAHGEVLISLSENVEGMDMDMVREKLGGEPAEGESEPMATVGAAGDKKEKKESTEKVIKRVTTKDKQIEEWASKYKEVEKELAVIKQEREAEKAELAKQKRLSQATAIVDHLIAMKQIPESEKEKKITFYNEMKDEKENLVDLTLYASEIKALKPSIVGSSGADVYYRLPTPNVVTAPKTVNTNMLKEVGIL